MRNPIQSIIPGILDQPDDRSRIHVLIYHTDPGHGWLAVPAALYHRIGSPELSGYSYVDRQGTILAEEDCDMAKCLDALEHHRIPYRIDDVFHAAGMSFTGMRRWSLG